MSLYKEYRPQHLDDVMGNTAVVQGLREHFSQDARRVSHVHLFSGPSGCGKTTLARIVATDILGADELSIHEINFAEMRGIDTAREVIERMKGLPLSGNATVFILDEAHGMTADAKRAFLKPLEDYPPHVYFFICTTNLDQLLKGDEGKAIGTRCTKWKVEPLTARALSALVSDVAAKENYEVPPELLEAIVDSADGSPRDALVGLEAVMPIKNDLPAQLKLLEGGVSMNPDTKELCRLLVGGSGWTAVAPQLSVLKGKVEPETLRRGILGYCQAVLLKKDNPHIEKVMEEFSVNTYDTGFPGITIAAWRATH